MCSKVKEVYPVWFLTCRNLRLHTVAWRHTVIARGGLGLSSQVSSRHSSWSTVQDDVIRCRVCLDTCSPYLLPCSRLYLFTFCWVGGDHLFSARSASQFLSEGLTHCQCVCTTSRVSREGPNIKWILIAITKVPTAMWKQWSVTYMQGKKQNHSKAHRWWPFYRQCPGAARHANQDLQDTERKNHRDL